MTVAETDEEGAPVSVQTATPLDPSLRIAKQIRAMAPAMLATIQDIAQGFWAKAEPGKTKGTFSATRDDTGEKIRVYERAPYFPALKFIVENALPEKKAGPQVVAIQKAEFYQVKSPADMATPEYLEAKSRMLADAEETPE